MQFRYHVQKHRQNNKIQNEICFRDISVKVLNIDTLIDDYRKRFECDKNKKALKNIDNHNYETL